MSNEEVDIQPSEDAEEAEADPEIQETVTTTETHPQIHSQLVDENGAFIGEMSQIEGHEGQEATQQVTITTSEGQQVYAINPDGTIHLITSLTPVDNNSPQGVVDPQHQIEIHNVYAQGDGSSQVQMEEVTSGSNDIEQPPYKRIKTELNSNKAPIVLTLGNQSQGQLSDNGLIDNSNGGADEINQSWFTSKQEKTAYKFSSGGQNWKQGQWSKEEIEILKRNIAIYCQDHSVGDPAEIIFEMSKDERKDFYRTVARGLNRPLFSVYRRVIRMYDQKNHIGKYSPEEIEKLKELRVSYGSDWATIGALMGRSASSVKDRCRSMKDHCHTGKWLPEEEKRLAQAVYECTGARPGESVTNGLSWATVATKVQTRSEKQCRTKWLNYLNWKQSKGTVWKRTDDIELVNKIINSGITEETDIDWEVIAENWSCVRSPQWLRGKWWTLKRHVPDSQNLPFDEVLQQVKEVALQTITARATTKTVIITPSSDNPSEGLHQVKAVMLKPTMQQETVQEDHMAQMAVSMPLNLCKGEQEGLPITVPAVTQTGEVVQDTGGGIQVLNAAIGTQGGFLVAQPQDLQGLAMMGAGGMGDHFVVQVPSSQDMTGVAGLSNQVQIINPHQLGGQLKNVSLQLTPDGQIVLAQHELQEEIEEDSVGVEGDVEPGLQFQEVDSQGAVDSPGLTTISTMPGDGSQDLDDQSSQTGIITQTLVNEELPGSVVTVSDLDPNTAPGLIMVGPGNELVQTTAGDFIQCQLSSFSDPMLTSDASELIGTPDDHVDTEEKHISAQDS